MPTATQWEIWARAKEFFEGDFVPGVAPLGCKPGGFQIIVNGKRFNKIIVFFDTVSTQLLLYNDSKLLDDYQENGFDEGTLTLTDVEDFIQIVTNLK